MPGRLYPAGRHRAHNSQNHLPIQKNLNFSPSPRGITTSFTFGQSTSQHSSISCVAAAACERGLRNFPPCFVGISMPPCTVAAGYNARGEMTNAPTISVGKIILTSGWLSSANLQRSKFHSQTKIGNSKAWFILGCQILKPAVDRAIAQPLTCPRQIRRLCSAREGLLTWQQPFDFTSYNNNLIKCSDVAVVGNAVQRVHARDGSSCRQLQQHLFYVYMNHHLHIFCGEINHSPRRRPRGTQLTGRIQRGDNTVDLLGV